MRFAQLKLENWRNFDQVNVRLQDRAFLVGPNASGKSNFLDVFRFLRDLVVPGGGFEQAVTSRGGVSSIRNLAARRYSGIVVEVCLQADGAECDWRYRIAFAQRAPVVLRLGPPAGAPLLRHAQALLQREAALQPLPALSLLPI